MSRAFSSSFWIVKDRSCPRSMVTEDWDLNSWGVVGHGNFSPLREIVCLSVMCFYPPVFIFFFT